MAKILEKILGRKRVLVKENERIIALHKGELLGIYGPGLHTLPNRQNSLEFVRCDLTNAVFVSVYEHALFEKLSDVANQHLTVFRTAAAEVAVIERDGAIFAVMRPNQKLIVWNDAGPWSETRIDVSDSLAVDSTVMRRIVQVRKAETLSMHLASDGQVGLLFIDGKQVGPLNAGMHGFWNIGKTVQVKVVDQKWQALDVTGQELLTRDRVTIRINIAAEYRVVDPVKAVNEVKDFADALYRALQVVFRRTLGNLTLDQILESKVTINEEAAGKVRENMAAIGIEISNIELKDVILPGEMREILNQVVTAEKQAEANVIRRREDTNATRSLLNTANVMAENPVMLRLKELEALEAIAGKVERLTIHNGTGGLMNDLVKLRD